MRVFFVSLAKKSMVACTLAVFVLSASSTANAHMPFKKRLESKYPGMKVSCNACHVKGKPKTERTKFGKLFVKQLKKTNPSLTKEYKPKKGDEKKAFEKETLIPAFDKALKIVKAEKNKEGQVYDELIKNAEFANIKKDPKYKPPGSDKTGDEKDKNSGGQ